MKLRIAKNETGAVSDPASSETMRSDVSEWLALSLTHSQVST